MAMFSYCTRMVDGCQTEVCYTPLRRGYMSVHVEVPDSVYGFKTLDCTIPGYRLSWVVGFSDEELAYWLQFCRYHSGFLLELALEKEGCDGSD